MRDNHYILHCICPSKPTWVRISYCIATSTLTILGLHYESQYTAAIGRHPDQQFWLDVLLLAEWTRRFVKDNRKWRTGIDSERRFSTNTPTPNYCPFLPLLQHWSFSPLHLRLVRPPTFHSPISWNIQRAGSLWSVSLTTGVYLPWTPARGTLRREYSRS